jgi:hypothetical protein
LNFIYQLPAFEQNDSWRGFSIKDAILLFFERPRLTLRTWSMPSFEEMERRPSSDKRTRDQAILT